MKVMKQPLGLAVCAVLLAGLLASCAGGEQAKGPTGQPPVEPKVGFSAPDFKLATPDGKSVALSDFAGRPVLLNFWATWCVPCRAELPMLEEVYKEQAPDRLVVLGVDLRDPPAPVNDVATELGLTFPLALDRDSSVTERYQVLGLPASFFIDSHGVIRSIKFGPFLTKQEIESKVRVLIAA